MKAKNNNSNHKRHSNSQNDSGKINLNIDEVIFPKNENLEPDGSVDRPGCIDSTDSRLNKYCDYNHHFSLLFRQDFLNYDLSMKGKTNKDFVSFRRFQGTVVSKKSEGINYVECTAYRTKPGDIKVSAFDLSTNKRLKVKIIDLDPAKGSNYFPIFIYFPKVLQQGETFDVSLTVVLPKELSVLDSDDRMSICLGRITAGIDKLIFNVCLDFEPTSVKGYKHEDKDFDKRELSLYLVEDNQPKVEEYKNYTEFDNYGVAVDWGVETLYIIKWECDNPSAFLYAIEYSF